MKPLVRLLDSDHWSEVDLVKRSLYRTRLGRLGPEHEATRGIVRLKEKLERGIGLTIVFVAQIFEVPLSRAGFQNQRNFFGVHSFRIFEFENSGITKSCPARSGGRGGPIRPLSIYTPGPITLYPP